MNTVIIVTDGRSAERAAALCPTQTLLTVTDCENGEESSSGIRKIACKGGRGSKLRAAFACAFGEMGADAVITLPAECECSAEDVEKIERALSEGASVAVCDLKESSPLILGSAFSLLTRFTAGLTVAPWASLRGYKADCAELLASVKGEGVEYEAVLLQAIVTEKLPLKQFTAEKGSGKSRPCKKSLKTTFLTAIGLFNRSQSLKFLFSSGLAFVIDTALFMLIASLLPWGDAIDEMVAQPIAWIISSLSNFTINQKYVFGAKGGTLKALGQYYSLAIFVLVGKMGLLYFFSTILSLWRLPSKLACEVSFFLLNYLVQKKLIFRRKKAKIQD